MSDENPDPRVELGRRIAEHRRARKLTPEGLAAASQIDVSNLRRIEQGANPRLDTLLKIVGVLEIDLGELFAGLDPYALPEDRRPRPLSDFADDFWRPRDRIA